MTPVKKNVAVFFGGKSTEHEVSVITGIQVINNIDKEKYNVLPIYIAKDGTWYYGKNLVDISVFKDLNSIPLIAKKVYLSANPNEKFIYNNEGIFGFGNFKINIDIIFPCFHGGTGEDGSFQGLFEICEIPYVGSEVLGSALGMDKLVSKSIFISNKIPTASYMQVFREEITTNIENAVKNIEKSFKYPIFIKPAVGGSSIGVTKAVDRNSLKDGLELAAALDSRIIVEEGIENAREINISVIGNTGSELLVSACEEVFHEGAFLTYDDKYKSGDGKSQGMASTKRKIPAQIKKDTLKVVEDTARNTFNALNCYGLVRVDFLVRENPLEVFVLEVNTIPGSMGFYLWESVGMPFKKITTKLIDLAEQRFNEKKKNIHIFSSDILKDFKPGLKSPKLS